MLLGLPVGSDPATSFAKIGRVIDMLLFASYLWFNAASGNTPFAYHFFAFFITTLLLKFFMLEVHEELIHLLLND